MPRECAISQEEAVDVIIKYFEYFKSNIPSYSDKVWDEICLLCEGSWTKKSWFTNITYDRRNILSIARERMGFKVATKDNSLNTPCLDQTFEELDSTVLSETTHLSDNFLYTLPDEVILDLYISPDEWHQIKPIDDSDTKRTSNSLHPDIWTNIIAKAFWRQHRLPCAFSFKNSQVNISMKRKFFLKITGECRSKKCGNKFIGLGYNEPQPNAEYLIRVKTRDTTYEDHEDVTRYLNGKLRLDLGKQCMAEGSNNVLKRIARENLKRGDLAQPIIPSLRALQDAKCEEVNKMLNVKKEDRSDPIAAIYNMQFDNEHLGSIHDVSLNPFYVIYGTSEQIATFQKYCRTVRNLSKISIDATGSLVAKIDRPKGTKSAHIFLYAIVINFQKTIQSVYQMLTEAQDTGTIFLWLDRFLRKTNKKPQEVITDYSRALLSAVSLAFNKMGLSIYVGECFKIIMNKNKSINESNSLTYIRVDVAHLIHLACRWKCWKKVQQTLVRDFFLRCLSLLVDCQTIEDFEIILESTFIIAYQRCSDTMIKFNDTVVTVNETFKKLQNFIAYRGIDIDKYVNTLKSDDAVDEDEVDNGRNINEDVVPVENIEKYINRIINDSQTIITEGEELNAYYCPEFGQNLGRLSKEFPLWTGVTTPYIASHASSSSSEANFGELKNSVLQNFKKNLRVDKFLRIHLRDVIGGTRKFDSNLMNFIQKRHRLESPPKKQPRKKKKPEENEEQVDHNDRENWRNQGGIPLFHDMNNNKRGNQPITISDEDYDDNVHDYDDNDSENCNNDNNDYDGDIDDYCSNDRGDCDNDNDKDCDGGINGYYSNDHENCDNDNDEDDGGDINDCSGNDSEDYANINDDVNHEQQHQLKSDDNNRKKLQYNKEEINNKNEVEKTLIISDDSDKENDKCEKVKCHIVKTHNKQQLPPTMNKQSKYFAKHPEILFYNSSYAGNKQNRIEKKIFLINGGLCTSIYFEKIQLSTYIQNTCAFDSIASIIATAAIDNPSYLSIIENNLSHQSIFNFIKLLITTGTSSSIERERGRILFDLYEETLKAIVDTNDKIKAAKINCWDSARNLWVKLSKNEPSAIRTTLCEKCGRSQKYEYPTISPSHHRILENGFSNMQSAIDLATPKSIRCLCSEEMTEELYTNDQIYIELDIRRVDCSNKLSEHGEKCKIEDIPPILSLREKHYKLAGIVAYIPGHFLGYCYRSKKSWELYNDLSKNKVAVSRRGQIEPHGLIYINANNCQNY